ncbi:hypothetical protein EV421DRAFT_1335560 [Armillaria borealis]|uniref:F-box domain-containing protein n=1 Tax=Armillaria borealis TaxID=47425 RepID=A0AA39J1J1_9AGAR|nr:hypothetical protein EV421DRAFT_1335560 [Armillaria borealis]
MQPTLCKKCRGRFYVNDLRHVLPPSLVTDLRNGIQINADVHAESMRQTLAGLIPKLDKYDAEIRELEETLAYLKHRRTDLAHSISVYKTYLAPIRRLPVELLCKFFLEASAVGDRFPIGNDIRETFQSHSQTSLRIASVCSYWRSVSLSFPPLWSVMFIDADDDNLSRSTRELLSLYQRRSCTKPIHIGISAQPCGHRSDDIPILPYMSLKTIFSPSSSLLNFSSCCSLIFDMRLASPSDLALPSPGFVSLERLDLVGFVNDSDINNTTTLSSLFHDAPQLRELHLHDTWSTTFPDVGIDCSAIRTLWLEQYEYDTQWDEIVRILGNFPSLDVLVFYCGWFKNITTTVTIPGVRVLRICAGDEIPVRLLHVLMLPDLRCLEIFDDEKSDGPIIIAPEEIDVIVASFVRSSFINELRFDKVVIRDVDLIRILESVPKLTKVALVEGEYYYVHISITDELLDRMMMDADFLPKLEDLELVWAEENEIEEGKVLSVIENRCGRLRSVIVGVRGGRELKKKTLQRIQRLRELGLSIQLY